MVDAYYYIDIIENVFTTHSYNLMSLACVLFNVFELIELTTCFLQDMSNSRIKKSDKCMCVTYDIRQSTSEKPTAFSLPLMVPWEMFLYTDDDAN